MKKQIPLLLSLYLFIGGNNTLHSQFWMELMDDPNATYQDIENAFEQQWANRTYESGQGYKQYKRWESVVPWDRQDIGKRDPRAAWREWLNYKAKNTNRATNEFTGNWELLGPTKPPVPVGWNNDAIGRIDCFAFHPTDSTTFFSGSPSGGLWKTTDNGANWSPLSDDWAGLGISDIAVHPISPNILYVATGTRDGGSMYSFGILKSIDGGTTWSPTGEIPALRYYRLLIHPSDADILLLATNTGVYRTTNGGEDWTIVPTLNTGIVYDLEFHPTDPNIVYAIQKAGAFYKSTDNGISFTTLAVPFTNSVRSAIAVSPAAPDDVVVSCSDGSKFLGLYRSTSKGDNFIQIADPTNAVTTLTGFPFSTLNNALSFQVNYNWSLALNPQDANEIYLGAIALVRTPDNGATWQSISHGHGSGRIHVDIHAIEFHPITNKVVVGSDGGIYRTPEIEGIWDRLNNGLAVTQLYRLGSSTTEPNVMMIGNQDNGLMLYDNGEWIFKRIGDGMESIIHPRTSDILYSSTQNGNIMKSTTRGTNWTPILNEDITGQSGAWTTPYLLYAADPDILFAGYNDVWKSVDGGNHWENISTGQIEFNRSIDVLKVAKSNPDYIYIAKGYSRVYKTIDGGTNWQQLTLPFQNYQDLLIHPENPNTIWVSGSDKRIYKSVDGGETWTDVSGSLPFLMNYTLAYQEGTANGIYAGMEVGIYYKDDSLSDWILFNSELPNVIIRELEINYCNGKIRAATYGRGLWESDLYSFEPGVVCCPPTAPVITPNNFVPDCGETILTITTPAPDGYAYQWFKNNQIIADKADQTLDFIEPSQSYTAIYQHPTCPSYTSDAVRTSAIPVLSTIYEENFESATISSDWHLTNNAFGLLKTDTCSNNEHTILKFFGISPVALSTELWSGRINLNGIDSIVFSFDMAHTGTVGDETFLDIEVSTNCGMDFSTVYSKSTFTGLQTVRPTVFGYWNWTPTSCGDWREETINLTEYLGQEIIIRFRGYLEKSRGQNFYLDNIKIEGFTNCDATTVHIDESIIQQDVYRAVNEASAKGIVESGNTVVISAGNNIQLLEGFHAQSGSDFHAYITSCTLTNIIPERSAIVARSSGIEMQENTDKPIIQIVPNPLQQMATIRFYLPQSGTAQVIISDLNGQVLTTQIANNVQGWHTTQLDATTLTAGMYYVILKTSEGQVTERVVVVE